MKKQNIKKAQKLHFLSLMTYELQPNIFGVVKTFFSDYRHYKIINWRWKYNKNGF